MFCFSSERHVSPTVVNELQTKETTHYSNMTKSYCLLRFFQPQKNQGETRVLKEVRQGFANIERQLKTAV